MNHAFAFIRVSALHMLKAFRNLLKRTIMTGRASAQSEYHLVALINILMYSWHELYGEVSSK